MRRATTIAAMVLACACSAQAGDAFATPHAGACSTDCHASDCQEMGARLDAARKEGSSHALIIVPDANYPSMARVLDMDACLQAAKSQPAGTLCVSADASLLWRKP